MKTKQYWVEQLQLEAHPEGGYYKETYRAATAIEVENGEKANKVKRNLSTAIYFLLDKENFSAFHKIKSDEMWHFYEGDPLIIHMIDKEGVYTYQKLGRAIEKGELLQFVVPKEVWFASEVADGGDFSLVGCTVAYGFDFEDFVLADGNLKRIYPQHEKIIDRLIRVE